MSKQGLPPQGPRAGSGSHTADQPTPFELLHGHIDEVLAEWRSLVAAEPWATLSPARLVDALPELLPRLFRLASLGAQELDHELSNIVADRHGYFRRADGVPLGAVAEEWNHLRRAFWKVLQRHHVPEDRISTALQRLDLLIDDAIGLTLRGYYAPELDELRGRGLERRAGIEDRRAAPGDRRRRD